MRSHFRNEIGFVKHRKVFFAISAVMIVLALVGLLARGLNFGIEFLGGTQVTLTGAEAVQISDVRDAAAELGQRDAQVQSSTTNGVAGYMVRTAEDDPVAANEFANELSDRLGLDPSLTLVQTIGPNWGADVTRSMAIAFFVVIALIILFVGIRYEFKMAVMGVASLIQVLVIVAGVYAWTQIEVNPNVVAALLTIMGYCLYDTVVVFNRVNENISTLKDGVHRTALQITNYSENQVIVRSINTTLTSVVPVFVMLLFGGETLKGFAFAMFIGLVLSSYSSIMLAAPLYALWKGREEHWAHMEQLYGEKAIAEAVASIDAVAADVDDEAIPAQAQAQVEAAARSATKARKADAKAKKNKVR